jgi:glycosyltransferase involved in cell wall biosynthesis
MRVLVFHGYLLRGTGSNVYNASLARALAALGHQVDLLCQDLEADSLAFVDAVGDWDAGTLSLRTLREPVQVTAYRPDIGRVLPLYVADRYEGFDARPFSDLSRAEVEHYVEANVAAVRDVVERSRPDVALANHAVMGPAVLARALRGEIPYAVKIHGSALEYTVRPEPERFEPYAAEGIAGASGVLVGSRHTANALWGLIESPGLRERTRLGPPGVDVENFRPRSRADAAARLGVLADRLESSATASWGGEPGAAGALRALDPARDRLVAYVGKLIVSKGVDLLLAAWPLVVRAVPEARLVVIGFGAYRDGLLRLVAALGDGDLDDVRAIAAAGRELEGGPREELSYLAAFLDGLTGEGREAYVRDARAAAARIAFTGRLDHEDLPDVLPACEAQVVPSTFPEAFGMVAAEAAACGALPLSAAHSGLAEVTEALSAAVDDEVRPLLSFTRGPGAVEEIAAKLVAWLTLDAGERARASEAMAVLARERFAWEGVARGVIAAAQGRLDELVEPGAPPAAIRPANG